jgi:hypothetical protein
MTEVSESLVMSEKIGVLYSAYQFAKTYLVFSASRYFPCLLQYYQLALKGSSAML